MELIVAFLDVVLHLDRYLQAVAAEYGTWIYLLLFLIIFCETGLVVTPLLPGDSLLFVSGTLAAAGAMDVHALAATLMAASFSGDNTNYWIGRYVGPRVFTSEESRWLNRAYLDRTHRFYERHGGKTVVIARFMPIVRTFAPFVAGIGRMGYPRFLFYSFAGSVFWISFFVYGGYHFGNIPVVKQNLTLVIVAIVILSVMPGFIEYLRARARSSRALTGSAER
ncbi:MAG: DedA family protein [Betaproteobacteria bacterium]|nr:DedA family protein [Betaproteobacteria bacterium]